MHALNKIFDYMLKCFNKSKNINRELKIET